MRFWKNVVRLGAPFGAVMLLVGLLFDQGLLPSLVATVVTSAVLGLLGARATQYVVRVPKGDDVWRGGWMALVGGLLGIVALAIMSAPFIPRGYWHRIPDAPERPVRILCHEYGGRALYVEAASGEQYEGRWLGGDFDAWVAAEAIPTPFALPEFQRGEIARPDHAFAPPPAPGRILDGNAIYWQGVDYYCQTDYALLKSGSLWKIDRCTYGNRQVLLMVLMPLIGAIVGALEGALALSMIIRYHPTVES